MTKLVKSTLSKISIKGFRSIRDSSPLPLKKGLNVLIGGNGAGKSNFINFFRMLGHMMDPNRGLQNFIAEYGRADALLFRGLETTQELSAYLEFDRNCYQFSLRAANDGSMFFGEENIHFNGPEYGMATYPLGTGHLESKLPQEQSSRKALSWTFDALLDWRVYHFHNTSRSAPVMRACNIVDNERLREDAGNIAPILLRIREESRPYYDRIISHVRQAAPFFGDFVFNPDLNGQVVLAWKERYSEKIYYPSQLSDGSIRLICLATLLLQPNPPAAIIIDEPELGLHPSAITVLAGMLTLASENRQLIVCTQSSPLVNYLNIEDLIIVDRKDGESVFSRPDAQSLSHWLEKYSLGELWDKNLLGGKPQP